MSPRPFLSTGTRACCQEAQHLAGEDTQGFRLSLRAGPLATEAFPTPLPQLSGAGLFSGSEEAPEDRRVWWPWPSFRFHLTQPAHLISASPPRGSHPPPAQPSPAEAGPRAFEVRRISIPEEPAGPKPPVPAGEGTAGTQTGGGCPSRRGR